MVDLDIAKNLLKYRVNTLNGALDKAKEYNVSSIAIPLLGTGVGHLKAEDVMEIYHSAFDEVDMDVKVYIIDK